MKLSFKAIMLLGLLSIGCKGHCVEVVSITHLKQDMQMAKKVIEIIVAKFHVPRKFIKQFNSNRPCNEELNSIYHFCINDNKELEVLKMNPSFYKKNLKVFRKKEFTNLDE